MRVFADTNVLFAALATRGLCADLLRTLIVEHDLVVGEPVLAELRRNLAAKLRLPEARIAQVIAFLEEFERAPAAPRPQVAPKGITPADAAVLACAALARAEAIVTGDRALVALGIHAGIPILSPRGLWERLRVEG